MIWLLHISGKPLEAFIRVTELNDVTSLDEVVDLARKDINKWAKATVKVNYELNKNAEVYHKVSSQALLPSLRIIGQLIVEDDGNSQDLDEYTLKKFEQFDATAKQ